MRLEIYCEDRVGIVQEVLNILVQHQINLRKIEVSPSKQRMYVAFPEVEFEKLQKVMPQIRRIDGIGDVKTITFIPSEREHNELIALLKAIPEGIISVDTHGTVLIANQAALSCIGCVAGEVIGHSVNQFFSGFDIGKWFEQPEVSAQTIAITGEHERFIADLLPIRVSGESLGDSLVGAVISLKSESRLGEQVGAFRQQDDQSFNGLIHKSPAMKKVLRDAKRMAHLAAPMLLWGETGTGKETLAKACHDFSRGKEAPFLALNCASIPDEDAEVELFGRAAASQGGISKAGLLEQANGGTIFLDEVGDMSRNLQAKLVRFLHGGSFRRVGDEKEVTVNVRVICSTQKDLNELVQKGAFREDLYYRINVLTLSLPTLRERKQDVIPLALHFIHKFSQQLGYLVPSIDQQCENHLKEYAWPGNVRQLENALYRAVTLLEGEQISLQHLHLPSQGRTKVFEHDIGDSLDNAVKSYEAGILRELFPSFPSSRQLAKRLGLSHTAVANKLREYGINKKTLTTAK